MQKLIRKQITIILIISFIETICGGVLFFLIDNDIVKPYICEILAGTLLGFVFFNLIVVLISYSRISNARSKTDISSLSIIGNDVEEAYNFGKVGLIITDANNEVIWLNKMFATQQNKLIDRSIFEWQPGLKALLDTNLDVMNLEIDNVTYRVKYLSQAHLFIFKDISEIEATTKYSVDHAPAVGIISIDNYQDLTNASDDTAINDAVVGVQNSIVNYAKEFNMLLKKYKNDSYLFICNYSDYCRICEDRFSLLKDVRKEESNIQVELTLSIGISTGLPNYSRLFELASAALDVAFSRGGNQAVISKYGENLKFEGGLTEAKEKKNTVKARSFAKSLAQQINEANAIYIMGHSFADLDAIGSSLGLYVFATAVSKSDSPRRIKVVYDEATVELKTRKAFKTLFTKEQINEMTISSSKAIDEINSKSLLILTDVHNPEIAMSKVLAKKATRIAVLDHHRRGENCVENPVFSNIEPSASSASEMVAEMIRYSDLAIEVPAEIATFMLSGIILDTNHYRNKIGAKTYDASYILKTFGADNAQADGFLKDEYEEGLQKAKIVSNSEMIENGVVLCIVDGNEIVNQATLAGAANNLMNMSGVNAAFVLGRVSNSDVGMSGRSDGTISCQRICEQLGGGGHLAQAATKFVNVSLDDAKAKVKYVFDQYLDEARQK